MAETEIKKNQYTSTYPAAVAKVLSPTRLVINRGEEHGVKHSQRFLIYELSDEEIIDPITKESLGYLESYKGTGKIVHLQDKMSILESDKPHNELQILRMKHLTPFDRVVVGDKVRPI